MINTVNYIAKIAREAADRITCNAWTLKQAKQYVADNCNAETATYAHIEDVDFNTVSANLSDLATITRKTPFVATAEALVNKMTRIGDDLALQRRVAHTIKRAAAMGLEVTAADVLATSAAQATANFNVSLAVDELKVNAENAATPEGMVNGFNVEVGQVIEDHDGRPFVVTLVMRMAGYTDASGHVEGAPNAYRSHRFDTCNANTIAYGKRFTRLVKDVEPTPTPEEIEAAHAEAIEADKERTVYRRWGDFFGANDFAARRRIVDQCHAEALRMNDAIDEQQEFLSLSPSLQEPLIDFDHKEALRLNAQHVDPLDPVATVKPVSESNGRVTYRVSIRGRAYLYTIGDAFAQLRVKQKGGTHHYRTVTSAYMLDQIVRAITRFRA